MSVFGFRTVMFAGTIAMGGLATARAMPTDFAWGEIGIWDSRSQAQDAAPAEGAEPASVPGFDPEILVAIDLERDALDARALELDEQEARIGLAGIALDRQLEELERLEVRLRETLKTADDEHVADITRLVRIYEAMKPQQAGAILDSMDLEVSTLVLAAMPEKNAGPVMANMRPVRAQAISKIIFERSKLPGDQNLVSVRID